MSSDSRNQVQAQRHRLVALAFATYRREARQLPPTAPDDVETPAMREARTQIWELHHAIALNEGW